MGPGIRSNGGDDMSSDPNRKKTLDEEIAELEGKFVEKGDVMAGIALILEMISLTTVAMGAAVLVKLLVATVFPPAAPLITGAVMLRIAQEVGRAYSNLEPHQRQVVAAAMAWITGKVSLN